jgi:hypothetical protein
MSPSSWQAFGVKPPQAQLFDLLRSAGHNMADAARALDELLRAWPEDRGLRRSGSSEEPVKVS